jgi:hypothetical protein
VDAGEMVSRPYLGRFTSSIRLYVVNPKVVKFREHFAEQLKH